jgi:hypothetical protein
MNPRVPDRTRCRCLSCAGESVVSDVSGRDFQIAMMSNDLKRNGIDGAGRRWS